MYSVLVLPLLSGTAALDGRMPAHARRSAALCFLGSPSRITPSVHSLHSSDSAGSPNKALRLTAMLLGAGSLAL
jgi:hypothetical protein